MRTNQKPFLKDKQYYKFCAYGFLKNLRFFEIFIMLYLLQRLDGNFGKVGILYSTLLITRALLEIPSGIIADGLGRKGSMVFSYSLYILSFLAFYFANSYILLFIPNILFGIADSFRTGTHKAMIFDYLALNKWTGAKTQYYGQTRSWSKVGSAVSTVCATLIQILYNSFEFIFLFSTVPYIIGLFLLISYPKVLDGKINRSVGIKTKLKNSLISSYNSLMHFRQIKQIFSLSYFFGFHRSLKDYIQPIIFSMAFYLPTGLALNQEKQKIIILGALYFIIHLISSFSARYSYLIPQYFKSTVKSINLLAFAGFFTGLLIAVILGFRLYFLAGLLFVPLFAFSDMQRPSIVSFVSESYEPKVMATILSVESQIGSLVGAILSLYIGIVAEHYNLAIAIGSVSFISVAIAGANRTRTKSGKQQ
jgi:MFS family permease